MPPSSEISREQVGLGEVIADWPLKLTYLNVPYQLEYYHTSVLGTMLGATYRSLLGYALHVRVARGH